MFVLTISSIAFCPHCYLLAAVFQLVPPVGSMCRKTEGGRQEEATLFYFCFVLEASLAVAVTMCKNMEKY